MTHRSKSRAFCVVASLALLTITPASSFAYAGQAQVPGDRVQSDQDSGQVTRGRASNRNARRQQAPAAPSPEQILAEAKEAAATAGLPCNVTNAEFRGITNADQRKVYELVCENDFGYMLVTGNETTPATKLSCIEVAATRARALAANPESDPGPGCSIAGNDNFLSVLASYGTQAGLPCAVNEGNVIGRKGENLVFEVGCEGAQGYRINRTETGWEADDCLTLASTNITCAYTTKDELIATVKGWMAGSDAASCDVTDTRYMGRNANGVFIEAACNGADGVIFRMDDAKVVQMVYPCAEAALIGGGCALTPGAPRGEG